MTIDYSYLGKVTSLMIDYIGKIHDNIQEGMKTESATPAAHNLFDIAEDAKKPCQADADIFIHFVAQLLYFSNSSCPEDIQLEVSFL